MTEPDQIEFHERVVGTGRSRATSLAARAGIVAGSAVLVVVGAVAAMGASPTAPTSDGQANLLAAAAPAGGSAWVVPLDNGFGGGRLGHMGFGAITITAINGSSLSLKTEDGWTRTIAITGSTTITKGGTTIATGDLAVGDEIRFTQEKASDGTYSITAVRVVLPTIGGEVTAVSANTITVTGRDGTTGTIHVDGDTTYEVNGTSGKALSDVTVGSFVIAEGTLRSDGSLDADAVHGGVFRGMRDGERPDRGFPGMPGWQDHDAAPTATPTPATAS